MFSVSSAQVPGVKWTKYYSIPNNPYADLTETFLDGKRMPDGGFVLAGSDSATGYSQEYLLKKRSKHETIFCPCR